LKSIFSKEQIKLIAQNTSFQAREGKIKAHDLFWTLTRCFSTHGANEVAGLHRSFIRDSHQSVSYSSFYDQLSKPAFFDFLVEIYEYVQAELYVEQAHKMPSVFGQFTDILAHDGSSWALRDCLAEVYPGRFNTVSPAAIEMHSTYSLKYLCFQNSVIAPDTQSEHDFTPEGKKDVLYLLDRGYMNNPRLQKIEDVGGFFINRTKTTVNPLIEKVYGASLTQKRLREGHNLKHRALKKGLNYDFLVRFTKPDGQVYQRRLLALYNPQTKIHNFFMTNLFPERVSLQDIGDLYRLRWQVELGFKELKSYSSLKRFLSGNEHIITGFAVMSLIAMQVRRYLVMCAEQLNPEKRLSLHKAAISASEFMPEFIYCMMNKGEKLEQTLLDIFYYLQAIMGFSNPQRKTAFEKVNMDKIRL